MRTADGMLHISLVPLLCSMSRKELRELELRTCLRAPAFALGETGGGDLFDFGESSGFAMC